MAVRRLLLVLLLLLGAAPAVAQSVVIVPVCGAPPAAYVVGQLYPMTMDVTGQLCAGSTSSYFQALALQQGIGALGSAPASSDTGFFSLNSMTQRLLQRVTTLIGTVRTATPPLTSGSPTGGAATSALSTSLAVKSFAGSLFGFYCSAITGGAPGYCVAYNSPTVPGTGALTGASVLDVCYFSTPAGCSLSRIPNPRAYGSGIVILVTTAATPFTYTTGTDTAFISADFQ